jgi:electron transfer flavoprotein beta subunit
MKALTLLRQVPDAESTLRTTNNAIDWSATKLVLDTMDEYGVEQALRLRESGSNPEALEVIALAVGPARNEEILRSALALGADRAILIQTDLTLDPIALSAVIAQVAKSESIDLILCGGRETDWDSEALGAAVAERLQWPQLTWTTELTLTNITLHGRHDVDEGSEAFTVDLPAVITTQQGLNEPRFATLPNLMKARRKELRIEPIDAYTATPLLTITNTELQTRGRRNEIITADDPAAAAAKLAEILRAETKAIA